MYLQSYVNKNSIYWHKNKCVDGWNRIKDPEINPHRYSHLYFNKRTKIFGRGRGWGQGGGMVQTLYTHVNK
jgi:hypothetical protein